SDNHAVEEVTFFVDRFVLRAVAEESAVRRAIERHYRIRLTPHIDTAPTDPALALSPPRPAFIPTTVAPPLPAAGDGAKTLFPVHEERAQDPFGRTAVGKKAAAAAHAKAEEEVV